MWNLGITTLSGSNGTAVQDTQHRVYKNFIMINQY